MTYRFRLTVAYHGFRKDVGDLLLDAFVKTQPDITPVISQNTGTGELSVAFVLEAENTTEAFESSISAYVDAAVAAGLGETQILHYEGGPVADEEAGTPPDYEVVSAS